MPAVTLGIETSGRSGHIALRIDGKHLDERELSQAGRRHAQTLIREIRDLLYDHHRKPAEVNLVACSHGPGSFTGLRVGVVCAKTLAWANQCQLTMVDTLHAIAAESPEGIRQVEVLADAQRGDVFLGRFSLEGNRWRRLGEIEIVNAETWAGELSARTRQPQFAVTGPGLQNVAGLLPDEVHQVERTRLTPAASTIAQLGESLARSGQLVDPMTVEPFYLRKSAAEEKREAAQQS